MSSTGSYDAYIIYYENQQVKIHPSPLPQVDNICIGYMRGVVPRLSSQAQQGGSQQSALELIYTGHPCHRTWAILVPQSQQAQASRQGWFGPVQFSRQIPIIEILKCEKGKPSDTGTVNLPVSDVKIVSGVVVNHSTGIRDKIKSNLEADLKRKLDEKDIASLPDQIWYVV